MEHTPSPPPEPELVPFKTALRVWARIGWLGFGGPAGQIALMHRELVERHRWISEGRFLHALNYCMLLPGPEAQQLAVYIGWLMHRMRGGVAAGLLFVLPGVLVLGLLSVLYVRFGQVPLVAALFFGLKAAVLAIVVDAVLRIGRRALKTRLLVGVAVLSFIAIFLFHVPFPLLVAGAALLGWLAARVAPDALPQAKAADAAQDQHYVVDRMLTRGDATHLQASWTRSIALALGLVALWLLPVALAAWWLGTDHVVAHEGRFFSQAAVVTFGGAYAVLAYVGQQVVDQYGWLRPGEMVDGLALAETTPGPLVMVLQFVGFVAAHRFPGMLNPWLAGCLGALMTTWVTFLPSFLFIFVGAPHVEALRRNRGLHAALSTVTSAVVGVILNLSVWFALHTVFGKVQRLEWGPLQLDMPVWQSLDWAALALSAAAMLALLRFRLPMGWVLAASALLGVVILQFRS